MLQPRDESGPIGAGRCRQAVGVGGEARRVSVGRGAMRRAVG